jgi:hypothetical protein
VALNASDTRSKLIDSSVRASSAEVKSLELVGKNLAGVNWSAGHPLGA